MAHSTVSYIFTQCLNVVVDERISFSSIGIQLRICEKSTVTSSL